MEVMFLVLEKSLICLVPFSIGVNNNLLELSHLMGVHAFFIKTIL